MIFRYKGKSYIFSVKIEIILYLQEQYVKTYLEHCLAYASVNGLVQGILSVTGTSTVASVSFGAWDDGVLSCRIRMLALGDP